MQTDLIIVSEYCRRTNLDPTFLVMLEEGGLIDIYIEHGEKYFPSNQLLDLERYTRMYYDLSINIEGIDAIRNILSRMRELHAEISHLREKINMYESNFFEE